MGPGTPAGHGGQGGAGLGGGQGGAELGWEEEMLEVQGRLDGIEVGAWAGG